MSFKVGDLVQFNGAGDGHIRLYKGRVVKIEGDLIHIKDYGWGAISAKHKDFVTHWVP